MNFTQILSFHNQVIQNWSHSLSLSHIFLFLSLKLGANRFFFLVQGLYIVTRDLHEVDSSSQHLLLAYSESPENALLRDMVKSSRRLAPRLTFRSPLSTFIFYVS